MKTRSFILALAAVVLLPSAASATHFDGNATSGSFNPGFGVTVANTFAGQTGAVTLRITQQDHEDPPIVSDLRIPGAWQFDATLPAIRRAQKPDGTDAGSCPDAIDGRGNGVNGDARFARAEIVGSAVLLVHLDGVTRTSAPGSPANPTDTPLRFDGDHALLAWDEAATKATLCLLLTTDDPRISSLPIEDIEGATELVAQYEMARVDTGSGPEWRVLADLTSLAKDATIQTLNVSVLDFTNVYAAASAGNWHPSPAPVAKNPAAEGDYTFRAMFTTCPADDASFRNCKSGRGPVHRSIAVTIRLPSAGLHPIPRLIAPAPFSVHTGTSSVPLRWEEVQISEQPVGYVVTVARPGEPNRGRMHQRRVVAGDPAYPCDGSGVCSTTIAFPLPTTPFEPALPADGRYAVSVIAIFGDGHRSDGRCDDGTPAGTTVGCSARVSHPPGWDGVEFLVRDRPWPLRWQDPRTRDVLLVDPGSKELEYVVWLQSSARQESYAGRDPLMTTDGRAGRFQLVSPVLAWSVGGAFAPDLALAIATRPATAMPNLPGGYPMPSPRPFVGLPV